MGSGTSSMDESIEELQKDEIRAEALSNIMQRSGDLENAEGFIEINNSIKEQIKSAEISKFAANLLTNIRRTNNQSKLHHFQTNIQSINKEMHRVNASAPPNSPIVKPSQLDQLLDKVAEL
jgi:hypothetical protein